MAKIIRGSDRTLRVMLKTLKGEPFDLTDCSAVTASFMDEDDQIAQRTFSGGHISFVNRGGGVINIRLAKDFTATLKAAERQTFQVEVVVGPDTRRVYLYEALTVEESMEDG